MLDSELVARDQLDAQEDTVTMQLPQRGSLENEKVHGSLAEIARLLWREGIPSLRRSREYREVFLDSQEEERL